MPLTKTISPDQLSTADEVREFVERHRQYHEHFEVILSDLKRNEVFIIRKTQYLALKAREASSLLEEADDLLDTLEGYSTTNNWESSESSIRSRGSKKRVVELASQIASALATARHRVAPLIEATLSEKAPTQEILEAVEKSGSTTQRYSVTSKFTDKKFRYRPMASLLVIGLLFLSWLFNFELALWNPFKSYQM